MASSEQEAEAVRREDVAPETARDRRRRGHRRRRCRACRRLHGRQRGRRQPQPPLHHARCRRDCLARPHRNAGARLQFHHQPRRQSAGHNGGGARHHLLPLLRQRHRPSHRRRHRHRRHVARGQRPAHCRGAAKAHRSARQDHRLHSRPRRSRRRHRVLPQRRRRTRPRAPDRHRPRQRRPPLPALRAHGRLDPLPQRPAVGRRSARPVDARSCPGLRLPRHDLPRPHVRRGRRRDLRADPRHGRDRRPHLGLGAGAEDRSRRRLLHLGLPQRRQPLEGPALHQRLGRWSGGHRREAAGIPSARPRPGHRGRGQRADRLPRRRQLPASQSTIRSSSA